MNDQDGLGLTDAQKVAKFDQMMGTTEQVPTPAVSASVIAEWKASLAAEFSPLVSADTVAYLFEDMDIPTACGKRANTARYMSRYHKTMRHIMVVEDKPIAYCVKKKPGITNAPSIGVSLMMTAAEGRYDIPDGAKGEEYWTALNEVLSTGHYKGDLVLSVEDAKVLFAPVQILLTKNDDKPVNIKASSDEVKDACGLVATSVFSALDVPVRATTNTRDRRGALVW